MTKKKKLPTDPAAAAEAYAALGLRVIPIGPGAKYPTGMGEWRTKATDDLDTIRGWYEGERQGYGVGIVTGEASGVWVLDVDTDAAKGKRGGQSMAKLVAEHGPLPATVTSITGSGGLHLFFRWDPEHPITNGMSTGLPVDLDIRGEGGQVVAAPTKHPDTNRLYAWQTGRDPWSIEVAEAPDWLKGLLTSPPEPYQAVGPVAGGTEPETLSPSSGSVPVSLLEGPRSDPTSDSIADWVRDRFDWTQVLQEQGWQLHGTRGSQTWWTRPGKDVRAGHSAVLHGTDGPFVLFSGAIDPALYAASRPTSDGSGGSISLFDFLAVTLHGGDTAALGRQARELKNHEEGRPRPIGPTTAPEPISIEQLAPEEVGGFVDVGEWWDNPGPTVVPSMLFLDGDEGGALLYVDQLNWIHGDSGSGKTWVVLQAVAQLIRAGKRVLWVHYEDPTPATILERLKLLGLTRAEVVERFWYWDPDSSPLDTDRLIAAAVEAEVDHVVLDSVGEALNASGLDENADAEIGPWINRNLRGIVNEGIGCTVVDHAVKSTKNVDKLYPSGSKRKRAAVTGAGLLIESTTPPTKSQTGFISITCAKDRHGNHPRGEVVGVMKVAQPKTDGDPLSVTVSAPLPEDVEVLDPIAVLAADMLAKISRNPGLSKAQLVETAKGSRADARAAYGRLEADGDIRTEAAGAGIGVFPVGAIS